VVTDSRSSSSGEREHVVVRPDGSYWIVTDSGKDCGPFATRAEALAAIPAVDEESDYEPGETVDEARAEIGLAEWIDPDTGEPAEEDSPRLEDH
jgi:hypothetical protein